ncbi:MAG TPA: pyrimidine 5'-nucleotidase [Anaerolineae bacterium]|nr:pyrimidine 5'-nucleotidase [Anaerolineae bacterium]
MSNYRVLFLDLDDTLYPSTCGLWQAISDRIIDFMTDRLDMSAIKADELRKEYFLAYGTTFNGLRIHHNVDPLDYLDFVHDVPIDIYIQPDPELNKMLMSVVAKRVIFTNASRDHAERVTRRLGIEKQIDQVIDIIALDYHNKPKPSAYSRALSLTGEKDPTTCLLVDDRSRNLIPGGAMGMTTVLVGEQETDPHVDFHINLITQLILTVPGLDHGALMDKT